MKRNDKVVLMDMYDKCKCDEYKTYLFVYGDNDKKIGCKGQSIIRNMTNSIGIPTKKSPTLKLESFYTDDEYEDNVRKINEAIGKVMIRSKEYEKIVFPRDGLGTGLAQLPKRAPKTYEYLRSQLNERFGIYETKGK